MSYFPRNNKISTANSTTTPLDSLAVFTGTAEDVSQFDSVVIAVKTDQNGTFQIQFSNDGTNWDSTLTRYYRTSQIEPPHRFTITRKYCRVVFTNTSASTQTFLRMQTMFGDKADLNIPLDSAISQDYDSISVRPSDFNSEVALGRRQGISTWNKFGYNENVDTGAASVIADFGGVFQRITTGETIDIVSTSTDDTAGGDGCKSIVIYGVDENWDEQIVVIDLDGTTPVQTTESWLGVNRVAIYLAGSLQANAGTITLSSSTTAITLASMPVGEGTSQQLIFYVPRKHQFLATWLHLDAIKLTGGTTPKTNFFGWVFSDVSNARYNVYRDGIDTSNETHSDMKPTEPFVIGEKSVLYFEATTDTNNTVVRGRLSGKLFRNVDGSDVV